jgi:hypothetical protein
MGGFKNLNAATRLLLSFGVLMVFIAAPHTRSAVLVASAVGSPEDASFEEF